MTRVTSALFWEKVGLGDLSWDLQNRLLEYTFDLLESRIQSIVESRLSGEQSEMLEGFFAEGDAAAAFRLLRSIVPEYDEIALEQAILLERQLEAQAPIVAAIDGSTANFEAECDKLFSVRGSKTE